jgi:hypothetical protein
MIQKILILGFAVIAFGLFPVAGLVRAEASEHFRMAESLKIQTYRFGPYATLDRANQVANYARRRGYKAGIYYGGSLYSGTRVYYVDVWK